MKAGAHRWTAVTLVAALVGCGGNDGPTGPAALNPDTAPRASIDRFSSAAAMLYLRTATNGMPAANAPVNFNQGPFVTQGYGPAGQVVRYLNFDVMPRTPAPIYVFFRQGSTQPLAGQLNVVDAIPGDPGYNDFWLVVRVTVPTSYVANTATSLAAIRAASFPMENTTTIVNCPIVPAGSTAGTQVLTRGWYKNQVVSYFNLAEAPITATASGQVPISPIYVTFNINPDQTGGGPPSGFRTEPNSPQTHNVLATMPGQAGYSPLWEVYPYDNAAFTTVRNLVTAVAARSFGRAALVNCPVVP